MRLSKIVGRFEIVRTLQCVLLTGSPMFEATNTVRADPISIQKPLQRRSRGCIQNVRNKFITVLTFGNKNGNHGEISPKNHNEKTELFFEHVCTKKGIDHLVMTGTMERKRDIY